MDWLEYHIGLVEALNNHLSNIGGNHMSYLFGAHVYSQFLLGFGLKKELITGGILDNDVTKQGKRLCGTNMVVHAAKQILGNDSPVVILHAGTHNEEIKEQLLEINPSTVII